MSTERNLKIVVSLDDNRISLQLDDLTIFLEPTEALEIAEAMKERATTAIIAKPYIFSIPISERPPEQPEQPPVFDISIIDLELSVRALGCLQSAKIQTIQELVKHTETDLLRIRSLGKTSLREIKRKLGEVGLCLHTIAKTVEATIAKTVEAARATDSILKRRVSEVIRWQQQEQFRIRRAFMVAGIETIEQLIQCSPDELLAYKNFGRTSLRTVQSQLATLGLSLKDTFTNPYKISEKPCVDDVFEPEPVNEFDGFHPKLLNIGDELGIKNVEDFTNYTMFDLLKVNECGPRTLELIIDILETQGLQLKELESTKKDHEIPEDFKSKRFSQKMNPKSGLNLLDSGFSFSFNATKVLASLGVVTLSDLADLSWITVIAVRGCGESTIREIQTMAKKHNIQLDHEAVLEYGVGVWSEYRDYYHMN